MADRRNLGKDGLKRVGDAVGKAGEVVGKAGSVVGKAGSAAVGVAGTAVNRALHEVGNATNLVGEVFRLPVTQPDQQAHYSKPGAAPGLDHEAGAQLPPEPGTIRITCTDFSDGRIEDTVVGDAGQLEQVPRPEWATVRWLRIEGLHPYVVDQVCKYHGFHALAAEDVLHAPQRPRVERYHETLFMITQLISAKEGGLNSQQVSMFVREDLVVSFQEFQDDVWDLVHDRLQKESSRLRRSDASYLAYALLDAVVDHSFPVLDRYAQHLEELEEIVLDSQSRRVLQELHGVRRELALLRRVLWPTREMLTDLRREGQIVISETTRAYLGDVNDHCIQLIDMVDTFRDLSSNLTDLHLSLSSYRMNEVMQVLTVISTIFIPITFVAGVFGMNFENMPELSWKYGYMSFWAFCGVTTLGLLYFFRRKGWLG